MRLSQISWIPMLCVVSVAAAAKREKLEPTPATGSAATATFGAAICPDHPIMTMSNGTLYQADYFPSCGGSPQATYLFGDYDYPYDECPDYPCIDSDRWLAASGTTGEFQGLKYPARVTYMHRHRENEIDDLLPGQRVGESKIPAGPTQRFVRVDPKVYDLFVHWSGQPEGEHFAKVLKFEINRELAAGAEDQDVWHANYVGFELEKDPAGADPDLKVIEVADVTEVRPNSNDRIRRGQLELPDGETVEVLLLLKREGEPKK